MTEIIRHGRPERRYRGKAWWIGHVLRCDQCGCRYKVTHVDAYDIKHTHMFTRCPECNRYNLHYHSRFGRFMDWITSPSRPGAKA